MKTIYILLLIIFLSSCGDRISNNNTDVYVVDEIIQYENKMCQYKLLTDKKYTSFEDVIYITDTCGKYEIREKVYLVSAKKQK